MERLYKGYGSCIFNFYQMSNELPKCLLELDFPILYSFLIADYVYYHLTYQQHQIFM
jgi:hypothetical protein